MKTLEVNQNSNGTYTWVRINAVRDEIFLPHCVLVDRVGGNERQFDAKEISFLSLILFRIYVQKRLV